MFTWLSANLASLLVGLVLLSVVALAARKLIRDHRAGRHACGCGCGSCGGNCSGCAGCSACHPPRP
jgi:hypothetical protein